MVATAVATEGAVASPSFLSTLVQEGEPLLCSPRAGSAEERRVDCRSWENRVRLIDPMGRAVIDRGEETGMIREILEEIALAGQKIGVV